MNFTTTEFTDKNTEKKVNLITKTTDLAMKITLEYIEEGDTVVDATAGNGHDTLVLAEAVGENGKVLAFDIQMQALENTENLLREKGVLDRVQLVNDSHENLADYLGLYEDDVAIAEVQRPSAVIFNLGYLPLGDKSITTNAKSSVSAISAASKLIKIGGIVTLVLYCGHEEGMKEKQMILQMLKEFSSKEYHVAYTSMINQGNNPPEIVWITRKK